MVDVDDSCQFPLRQRTAGLLLWARRVGDVDRLLHGRRRRSKCGQWHVCSGRRKLKTVWWQGVGATAR